MQNFEEFLKELTALSLKYKIVLHGAGVYYGFGFDPTSDKLKGYYQLPVYNPDVIEWIDE